MIMENKELKDKFIDEKQELNILDMETIIYQI